VIVGGWRVFNKMNAMKWLFSGLESGSFLAHLGLAFLRVFTGLSLAFAHGIGKMPPSERFVESVGRLGFPMPEVFAWAAGISEFFGGFLLAAGFLTKPSAFFIMITMAVAAFMRHTDDPYVLKEKALLFACVALAFLLIGCGKYGFDAIIGRRLQRTNNSF
jgi:putative oxidoreductase